jgi:hypothetical protein
LSIVPNGLKNVELALDRVPWVLTIGYW